MFEWLKEATGVLIRSKLYINTLTHFHQSSYVKRHLEQLMAGGRGARLIAEIYGMNHKTLNT